MPQSKSVQVELAGIRLSVRTDASRESVHAIVTDIEERLRTINEQAQSAPLNRRLILTALTLGGDLLEARQDRQEAFERLESMERDHGELRRQLERLESMEREHGELRRQLERMERDHAELRRQLDAAKREAAREASEREKLDQALSERSSEMERRRDAHERADAALRKRDEELQALQAAASEARDHAQTALELIENHAMTSAS